MLYLVIMKEEGEGCDYTIGCGMNYEMVEAENEESLIKKIVFPDGEDENSIFENTDRSYEEIIYVPVDDITRLDIDSIKRKIENKNLEEEEEKQRKKDEEDFERLRKKLGK